MKQKPATTLLACTSQAIDEGKSIADVAIDEELNQTNFRAITIKAFLEEIERMLLKYDGETSLYLESTKALPRKD